MVRGGDSQRYDIIFFWIIMVKRYFILFFYVLIGCLLFHAGTKECTLSGETIIQTNGGRVIAVTSVADTLSTALYSIYTTINCIDFEGMHYRKDIGHRLENE